MWRGLHRNDMQKLSLSEQFAKHEIDDQQRFTDTQDAINAVGSSIPLAVSNAVKATVNGTIEKINSKVDSLDRKLDTNTNDTKWIRRIGTGAATVIAFVIFPFLGWLALLTIKDGDQIAALAATLKATQK